VHWVEPAGGAYAAAGLRSTQQIPYNIDRVRAPQAWPITRGASARLWVLDHGTAGGFQDHPDLPPLAPYTCLNMVETASIPDCTQETTQLSMAFNHGTAVAGVAVAEDNASDIVGVAPKLVFKPRLKEPWPWHWAPRGILAISSSVPWETMVTRPCGIPVPTGR